MHLPATIFGVAAAVDSLKSAERGRPTSIEIGGGGSAGALFDRRTLRPRGHCLERPHAFPIRFPAHRHLHMVTAVRLDRPGSHRLPGMP